LFRLFFSVPRPPPVSTLFPYTTLFRSADCLRCTSIRLFAVCASVVAFFSGLWSRWASVEGGRLDDTQQCLWPRPPLRGPICYQRSEEHTSELQSPYDLVCRLLLEKKKQ